MMKKIFIFILGFTIAISAFSASAQVLRILRPVEGGTGIGSATAGDVGKCLKVSDDSPFVYTLGTCASSGTVVSEEIPSGTINGSNNTFTLAHTPTSGTLHLFLNGSRRQQESGVNINDFNLTGTTITFDVAPKTGSTLFVDYSY